MDDKIDLESMDIKKDKINKLKEVYPEAVSEGKVDFEKLRLTLGDEVETGKERYGMNWPGKANCFKIIQTPSEATLKPVRDESVDFDISENLFIEGDNLEVLKLLQSSYYGKVKMIYIDPPYNTGNDFVYPDNYSESLETYLRYTGQKGESGLKFTTNTETEGRYHSKWMNMMYPRLFLAKNLLTDDGLLFISIDDNEVDNLRKICNEILGEENFIDTICWRKKYGGGAKEKFLVSVHEYILIYAKNKSNLPEILVPLSEESIKRYYKGKDDKYEKRGPFRTHPLEAVKSFDTRENLRFSIKAPDGSEVWPKRQWRWGKDRFQEALKNGEVVFNKNSEGNWVLYSKQYLLEPNGEQRMTKAQSVIDEIFTLNGTNEILEIFGDAKIFDFPKPSSLIKQLLNIGSNSDSIIIDFFAGSASTAHAVLELNKEDNGNRKFIMVQLQEPTTVESETYKAGYKNIAEIGKERIRRVIKKIKEEKDGKLDLDEKQDLGFRVFKLDVSNFKVWEGEKPEDLVKQLELYRNNVRDDSKPDDILYELILKSGFEISCKVEELEIQDKKVYSIEDGQLMICLEKGLTKELMREIAEKEPARVICLDEGFEGNDQLLTNTVEVLKTKGVEFRTV